MNIFYVIPLQLICKRDVFETKSKIAKYMEVNTRV